MKIPMKLFFVFALTILLPAAARAEVPMGTQIEIEFLLDYMGRSGCQFFRNGTWHDSRAAQDHLRTKYRYLVDMDRVGTAEEFIERAATASSISGTPYAVRCNGGTAETSSMWLRDELVRFRQASS